MSVETSRHLWGPVCVSGDLWASVGTCGHLWGPVGVCDATLLTWVAQFLVDAQQQLLVVDDGEDVTVEHRRARLHRGHVRLLRGVEDDERVPARRQRVIGLGVAYGRRH